MSRSSPMISERERLGLRLPSYSVPMRRAVSSGVRLIGESPNYARALAHYIKVGTRFCMPAIGTKSASFRDLGVSVLHPVG
jgi:hypothetical protein